MGKRTSKRRLERRVNRRMEAMERKVFRDLALFKREMLNGVTHLLEEFVPMEPKKPKR